MVALESTKCGCPNIHRKTYVTEALTVDVFRPKTTKQLHDLHTQPELNMADRTFVPRYKQPFTLEEAIKIEIPTLTAGMLRITPSS